MDDAGETPPELPPLPEVWPFPQDLLDKWVALPADEALSFAVSRRMLDQLFFAFAHLQSALADYDVALVAYSNGDLETANARLLQGREKTILSTNSGRQLLSGFMATAEVITDD